MDEDRIRRYWDKINLISKRSDEIREWIDISPEDFVKDEKTKLATYKAFQEIVEACMDIIAMMCKDLKIPPKDDYTNIELLGNKIPFDNTEKTLIEANGLKNRLFHRYNSTDDLRAFESIREILPEILNVVKGVKKWMRDIEQIRKDLEFLFKKVLAVVIYGSRVTGENTERSDIDVCIVAPNTNSSEIFRETLSVNYDIKIFELMTLYLKMEVIKNHEIVYASDVLEFYKYLYFFRKLWKDQEHRQELTKEEALHIFG